MSPQINRKKLEGKIRSFKNETAFLKFIRNQSEEDKIEICKLFPDNKYVKKYIDDRTKSKEGSGQHDDGIYILNEKDYEKATKDLETLLDKSPLNVPFLKNVPKGRFYEPRLSFFRTRPKMDSTIENDAKYLFRIINTHMTRMSSIYTKEEIEKKLAKISGKGRFKYRLIEADLRTNLALHKWILARSKTLSKNEKNDLFIEALNHLCLAMYMGGFSYFNVTSFGLVYNEAINNYKTLLGEKISQVMKHSQLYAYLPPIRNQLTGIDLFKNASKFLNNRLINAFETHSLDFKLKKLYTSDFKKAFSNLMKDKPDKMVNGIHSKVYIFLYLDLLIYLSCIHQMDLPWMLSEFISLKTIMEKSYEVKLRGHAVRIRRLLYQMYAALSKRESDPQSEPEILKKPVDEDSATKKETTAFDLLCKIMAECNQTIYEIRKKSNVDRYIEAKYFELYPLYRCYDALVKYIPDNEIDRNIKVFTINFLRDALFFKQQAIARQKDDRMLNTIQKMADVLKALYKRKVQEYKASMIKTGEPDYVTAPGDEE